jgi:uncharacterized membrane protein
MSNNTNICSYFLSALLIGLLLCASFGAAFAQKSAGQNSPGRGSETSTDSPGSDTTGGGDITVGENAQQEASPLLPHAKIVKPEGSVKLDEQFLVGRVLSVSPATLNKQLMNATGMVTRQEIVTVELAEGPFKGMKAKVLNEITDNPAFNVEVKPGSEVMLSVIATDSKANQTRPEINIADYHRVPALAWLAAAFLIAFFAFGGTTAFKSLAGLLVSVLLIAMVLLPFSMKGFNPLLIAAGICFVSSIATTVLVAGFSRKAFAAMIGTIGGVVIAGISAHLVITYAPLTGLSSEEAQILRGSLLSLSPTFYAGLLAAGMLIGALGVIMDVGISVASAVQEVAKANLNLPANALYQSGMNVGRDIMGTMTNTLILAYAGSALPLLLLTAAIPWSKLINLDLVATEVAASLTGSLGLVCTIPLTALAAAMLMTGQGIKDKELFNKLGPIDVDDKAPRVAKPQDLQELFSQSSTDSIANR